MYLRMEYGIFQSYITCVISACNSVWIRYLFASFVRNIKGGDFTYLLTFIINLFPWRVYLTGCAPMWVRHSVHC